MQLYEAKQILKNAGYIVEASKNFISPDVDELVNDIMAHPCFDQYADEWDYYSLAEMDIEWLKEFLNELEMQEDPEL